MGFFDIFSNISAKEELLIQKYSAMGLNGNDVKKALLKCKEDSKREGTNNLPENFGTYLLEKASQGISAQINFVKKRLDEGLIEEDIKLWWNLSDLDRRMINWQDNIFRISTYQH
jgi:hypothetical protein